MTKDTRMVLSPWEIEVLHNLVHGFRPETELEEAALVRVRRYMNMRFGLPSRLRRDR